MRILFSLNHVPWFDPTDPALWGGSEEAVVGLATALSARGHHVVVLSDWPTAHERDGVLFLQRRPRVAAYDALVLVKHRRRDAAEAKKVYLWSCDPDEAVEPDEFDRLVALSEWHARELRGLSERYPPERVVALPLGLPARILAASGGPPPLVGDRDPHRLVYASSFDRGLELLLAAWPKVREAVPDARLDVWYGWGIFDAIYAIYGGRPPPALARWKMGVQRGLRQTGVFDMDRLDDPADPRPFLNAAIWTYPCTGGERFCLTGQKAQALGAVPVVIPTMALDETVKFGWKCDGSVPYWEMLVSLMCKPDWQREERARMLREFKPWSWAEIAERWEREVFA